MGFPKRTEFHAFASRGTIMNEGLYVDLGTLVSQQAFDDAAATISAQQGEEGGGRMKRALSALGGSKLASLMAEKLAQIDLLPLFAKAWGGSPELRAEAEKSAADPNPKFVRLGKFEQIVELFPIVKISVLGLTSQPLKLSLTLEAEFDAVEVGLAKGHIVEAGGGVCQLVALLRYGQFSFPAGLPPVEFKLGSGRKFEQPGIKITGKKAEDSTVD
mgnify:FL=1